MLCVLLCAALTSIHIRAVAAPAPKSPPTLPLPSPPPTTTKKPAAKPAAKKPLPAGVTTTRVLELCFADGSRCEQDVVIGADGAGSVTHKAVWPTEAHAPPRELGQWVVQGICNGKISLDALPSELSDTLTEAWGAGTRFGAAPLGASAPGHWYWYATVPSSWGHHFLPPFIPFQHPLRFRG